MNPWKKLHNDFDALKEAEDGIARERVPAAHCYAYVTFSESGEVGCWVEDVPSESLGARFDLAASEAGLALGCPQGTPPKDYWLSRMVLDLRENGSEHLRMYGSPAGMIERLFEASAIFCSRLEQRALESPADLAAKLAASPVEESIDERSARRFTVIQSLVTPHLSEEPQHAPSREEGRRKIETSDSRQWEPKANVFSKAADVVVVAHELAVTTDPITDRTKLVDDFLLQCNLESAAGCKVLRKHIWLAVGHAQARQFQYWQERNDRATEEDDRSFRRILRMPPPEFLALLKKKGIFPSSS
jgi:hypothetical protein